MSSSLETPAEKAAIAAVRKAIHEAVAAGNADRLAELLTYDVVLVHADGRCTRGQDDVRKFFLDAFNKYDFEGNTSSSEVVVHGGWAVEIDEIQSRRTPFGSTVISDAALETIFVFSRQLDDSWKVSRLIELPD
jgi:uncharacterized protein (TIGR02246 family)